jgi:transcriptional regulator with AAA-type ATPase domain
MGGVYFETPPTNLRWGAMDVARTITRTKQTASEEGHSPYLFLVLQCDRPCDAGARFGLDGVRSVAIGRSAIMSVESQGQGTLRIGIPDPRVSSAHAKLEKVLGAWIVVDLGSKNGTFVDGVRVERSPLRDGALLEVGHTFFVLRESLPAAGPAFLDGRDARPPAQGLATFLPGLAAEIDRLALVAASRVPVLVQGETGTGKEVVAAAVHHLSGRPGPFVAVNCGGIAANLVESELFGFRKGAFSGAAEDRPGLVRTSDRGTLFLDEIGDLPLPQQAAILRVLQEEEVLAVGATRPVKVDLRVVAATHRDVDGMVAKEAFRADLLARLSGFSLHLPSLRERREDLGLILAALLRKHAGDSAGAVTLDGDAGRALLWYQWPLNVRELEKCLAGALVLARNGPIGLQHLPAALRSPREPAAPPSAPAERPPTLGEDDEKRRQELEAKLRENCGNLTAVARAMGKARTQIQRWVRRYRLDPESYRR